MACEKTARGNTAKLLLDKITENALMGTVLYQQGETPWVTERVTSQSAYLDAVHTVTKIYYLKICALFLI